MENSTRLREMDADFLALLVCPETRQSLRSATSEELARLQLDAALVREDGRVAYPVREGIPCMLPEEADLPPGCPNLEALPCRQHKTRSGS